ncbi:MAG: response regulator [Phycisphaerales bacterium]|nr:response regulator [Phycisphaerales bacterium]
MAPDKFAAGSPRSPQLAYSTGDVAEICGISQQTVIRCFDSGKLHGFRVPGSRFRRIPRDALIRFMKEHNIPLDRLDMGRRRILVVDDDPEIVEMLRELLERDGRFEVATAADGFDAGSKVRSFQPDLIVLDYMLPEINGNEVCRRIRSDPTLQHIRIIIVSGVNNEEERKALQECGADDFFQKPFSIKKVVERIAELTCAQS